MMFCECGKRIVVTKSVQSVTCSCGRVIVVSEYVPPKMGLGDYVAYFIGLIGLKSKSCSGCTQRKQWLNSWGQRIIQVWSKIIHLFFPRKP